MSSPGFRNDDDDAAASAEGPAAGPPGESLLTPVPQLPRGKPHRAPEAGSLGGVPGKLQDEGLPPPVGKATEKAGDRRPAGAAVLPQGQGSPWPPPLLLALSFNPSPSGSRLPTIGTLHSHSQPGQDGAQEAGSEAKPLPSTGPLPSEVDACHVR